MFVNANQHKHILREKPGTLSSSSSSSAFNWVDLEAKLISDCSLLYWIGNFIIIIVFITIINIINEWRGEKLCEWRILYTLSYFAHTLSNKWQVVICITLEAQNSQHTKLNRTSIESFLKLFAQNIDQLMETNMRSRPQWEVCVLCFLLFDHHHHHITQSEDSYNVISFKVSILSKLIRARSLFNRREKSWLQRRSCRRQRRKSFHCQQVAAGKTSQTIVALQTWLLNQFKVVASAVQGRLETTTMDMLWWYFGPFNGAAQQLLRPINQVAVRCLLLLLLLSLPWLATSTTKLTVIDEWNTTIVSFRSLLSLKLNADR